MPKPTTHLTTRQTAEVLGVSEQTLRLWRMTGRHGLPFFKIGRMVRYHADDVQKWLSDRRGTNSRAIAAAVA